MRQPKALIWGLRESQSRKHRVDRNWKCAPNFQQGGQAYKDKEPQCHITYFEIILMGVGRV